MDDLYPPSEPIEHGMLDVGDGNHIYWEVCGNPDGKPALVVHGGPGSGCTPGQRRLFDPARFRVALFDQRGCGRSTPHASDPTTDLSVNTTEHLLGDMERLRHHLAIERWLLFGGSWGSTLGLAYAQRHPERISEIVLTAITTGRHDEISWLFGGLARFFPEQWEAFRAGAPEAGDDRELLAAYARRLSDPDPLVRLRAARDWARWEDTVISLETRGKPDAYSDRPPRSLLAFVRIAAHYFSHRLWLEDEVLLRRADRLAGIAGTLIHGRLDLGAPLANAWMLARAWPDAELVIIDEAGHTGSQETTSQIVRTLDRYATT